MQRPSSLLFLTCLGVGACSGSDAPPPSEVRTRIATELVAVLDEAKASQAGGASLPDTTQFALLQGTFGSVLGSADFAGISTTVSARMAPRMASLLPADGTLDYDGAEAAQWLNDNLFTDANHAGGGIYNVPAALVCTESQYDDQGNYIGDALDPECAQAFGKIQLRIRVSENDDALKFSLQVGPNHDEPLAVGLSATLLSLSVDLDEAEDAIKSLAGKLGGQVPAFSLAGQATAKLEILGAAAAKISLDIDRNIAVSFDDASFSSKAAHVFAMTLDGTAKSMELALGLGETKAHIVDEIDGTFDLDLPGLTATATFAEGQPLAITNIGLGSRATTIKVDGATALSMDLNPNDGRKLDAQIAGDTLTVSPRLDFRTQVNHTALGDTAPVYDVTRVFLDGSLRGRTDDSVEVVGGSFSIETNPAGYGIAATAGQCVRGTETFDSTSGDYYTALSAGACL